MFDIINSGIFSSFRYYSPLLLKVRGGEIMRKSEKTLMTIIILLIIVILIMLIKIVPTV